MANDIALPEIANTALGNLPSWVTTLLGAVGAICVYLAGALDQPWAKVCEVAAGIITMVLGYSHGGTSK